jgi:hypothetical protein
LGKAFAQHAIESVVVSGLRPTCSQYVWKFLLLEGSSQKILRRRRLGKILMPIEKNKTASGMSEAVIN